MVRPLHLLAVTGLSPQVVTETLWALDQREPGVPFAGVTLLTTLAGREAAERLLPHGFAALAHALARPLPVPEIRLLHNAKGQPLEDILTDADNTAAANGILAAVVEATADPATRLHVSIAGGRKTMGALAAIALSLYGREGDRLSHVLVPVDLQGREDFFFPETAQAARHLTLAEIPFVRLRGRWRGADLPADFAAVVAAAEAALSPPRLHLDLARSKVVVQGREGHLPPALMATLLFFAECAKAGQPAIAVAKEADAALSAALRAARARCKKTMAVPQLVFGAAELRQLISRLNRRLGEIFGPLAEPLMIRPEGRRPHTRYRLALPGDSITIREDYDDK